MKKNIVIIGAGPSGLTAALEILRRSDEFSVTVLESSGNIGGISATVEAAEGCRMDIGGHRFYTKSQRVQSFWDGLMPRQGSPAMDELKTGTPAVLCENGADPQKTDEVMLNRRRVSRIYRDGKFYDYPISLQSLKTMGFDAVGAGVSYLLARVKKRKENTLEDFYINRFGKRLYSTFFESYTEKVWGVPPSELSPDWGAQRVRGLSAWSVIKGMLNGKSDETSLIKRFLYPKLGPGQLWECAAEEIERHGGGIILNSTVDRIKIKDGKVVSVSASGKEYFADILVSSMPVPQLISSIEGEIPTAEVKKTAENLHFRDFITVGVLVGKLKIKNRTKYKTLGNIPPDCWIYVQDKNVRMGRMQIFNNWSPYMVKDCDRRVFIGTEYFCSEGDELWTMPDSKLCKFAVSELEKIGIIEKNDVSMTHCVRMKKAYPSYNGSYGELAKVREYADSIGNLYCVGRNGQHRYNNMDHSMLTAMTAADIILGGGDKSSVWTVNPDGEYGE